MYRIKYLFGIFTGIFGLLYLLFAIVGWEDARDPWDKYTTVVLFFIHTSASLFLFYSSRRDMKREETRLNEAVTTIMLVHPVLTADLLAQQADMNIADAHEYLEKLMNDRR